MSTGIQNRLLRFVAMTLVAVMLVNFLSMMSNSHIHSPGNHMDVAQQTLAVASHDGQTQMPADYSKSMEECGMTSCSLVMSDPLGESHRLQITKLFFGVSGDRFKSITPDPLPRPPRASA